MMEEREGDICHTHTQLLSGAVCVCVRACVCVCVRVCVHVYSVAVDVCVRVWP